MYPLPPQAEETQNQAKLIVNIVIVVFLVLGLLLILQHFHFLFLGDVPVLGDWLMDMYERIFGPPHILILHGDNSIGDWVTVRNRLAEELIFVSEELDIRTAGSELKILLPRYSLVIVEDCRTMDKTILLNLDEYVAGGGNIIWVGDAGTIGDVTYNGQQIARQGGWDRDIVCVNKQTMLSCNCSTVKAGSDCIVQDDKAEQTKLTFSNRLGVSFLENVEASEPVMNIVDTRHWVVLGLLRSFTLKNVDLFASVDPKYDAGRLANIVDDDGKIYPGVVIQDKFGSSGMVVYFAYAPEETMEILKPLVERLRY